ncbi:uncharacterized protein LOC123980795 [Micropterus dolomieu]|uniref:uncharacterized protein LOC123980795 n=1 Tax=Micropterus dolomieu TaxID=147949 RepID=UPI001E8ED439|nr:uncharacterized protein LOC123980795 [Micropterus dolomieu]
MAESVHTMEDSDEENFYDASDSFLDLYCEGGEHTSPTPQSEYVPPPGEVTVLNAGQETVSLGLQLTNYSVGYRLQIDYSCDTQRGSLISQDSSTVKVEGLHPGTEYTFSIIRIADNGNQSKATSLCVFTEPCPPVQITVDHVSSESLSLRWDTPPGKVGSYIVTCSSEGEIVQEMTTDINNLTLSKLKPGACYSLQVSAKLRSGRISKPAITSAHTKTDLESLMEDLGLEHHYTLCTILQIDQKTISDEPAKCNSDLPWYFLKKLMMVNATARNVKCTSECESNCEDLSGNMELNLHNLVNSTDSGDMLNPLDIITALFLCSDGFVRQEMALKMSMCQFSVPLLLPNCDTKQCTLMLWAMRDLVKKYRPQKLLESKGFIEDRIVVSELPMISFVRLGECSLSKSETLNKLLSNSQQYHDTFIHRNMECGDSSRRISNGLTEVTWYLPCGNKNMDIFSEPVAVANLRGDIASFETQFSFLCQTSAAVFVFSDNLDSECELLINQHHKAQIFLVGNHQSQSFSLDALTRLARKLGLTNSNILLKAKHINDAHFIKLLQKTVSNVVENTKMKIGIEQMADIAHELGILVDEDCAECQTAKKNADAITAEIQDTLKYKEAQLPLQGQIWKELTVLEKEEFRLRKAGSENIEKYKSDLQIQKIKLREKQNSYDMSNAMTCFINAISSPGIERSYFLKWMRINLDNLSREKLSGLREQYKKKCENSENKEEIKEIDRQLSNSSLGTEHFFREMGQIYEASLSLSETDPSRQQLQHLPKLCAELLLDGFPLELVDGDASNIPLRWVSDVLSQLNDLVSPKSKILVVTVLGVQSTGKSTLLNTMFGVQFAVSSGRCTRGAFMLLIRINEDVKKELNCDFMVIIDTEGLKSPELAQLDNSHEHDNELATLVVGLSDITIINIAMENSTEMKDILQIVVHAFLRMKEVGKKPKCQFVHQNVSDVSAHDKNLRDRKLLLQQLNEMTQAAAKMEKKEENKSFTDVMEYSPDTGNWYIPGLWNGNPPMAPVNAGYSEAVYELKKNIKIDRQLSNSSLGTEHFFREMGQIYEASVSLPKRHVSHQQLQHLPKLCAELLLDGFPLELVDGDASNIPLRWVSDVLSQLNDLVSPKSKILVVTVLGVQSTGKSTLLNTMFGVQFAVSSGRCTRGAFMLLIRINEDVKKELNCDFMVIIDTEGLKSPELAQLDNSHEHDNELATLVVGLSDITIINIAMENSTEMKDILQIVVHAFLRMKEVGKKPKCQFVHQNVSDVSAHDKNLRDRKLLLQQLNEMTQAAAKMEKKEENKSFTDVMEYSPDTGNWYIPGLWNGNPPMAPVNAGYSEAVYELKKNIIQILGRCESSANNISEFTEWMESLWNAVKHENFIFSFRNSLVADAYMRLCTEFNKWEWEFKKEMYTWVTKAETRISNFGTVAVKSEISDMSELLTSLKSEACTELTKWETKLLENLKQYFRQTEGHVYLVERYREEFSSSAKSLRREMESSVYNQLTAAADIRQGMTELDRIKENHTKELEGGVHRLIKECRGKKFQMTDKELDKEFDKMWNKTVKELSFSKQKPKSVFTSVSHYLRENLSRKGSHACELLSQKRLKDCGLMPFKYTAEEFCNQLKHKASKLFINDHVMASQNMADSIIDACTQFVTEKMERKNNYHDTYIQEILHMIDERLQNSQSVKIDTEFEVSLKQHICGVAARQFQKMHEDIIRANDPYRCVNRNKEKFRVDFKDLFHERDQCQKKAEEFTNCCLRPAVEDFVNRSLGPDITGEMLTRFQFSTRMFFQYSVLLDLLSKDDFENYKSYICSYEDHVKKWTHKQIEEHFSKGDKVFEFEDRHVLSSISSINDAINKAKTEKISNVKTFIQDVCQELGDKLVISQDALGAFMILNNADQEQFAHWLTECVKDMAQALREKFKTETIQMKLKNLHVKPQNELFTQVIGCGQQCPFCKAPCDAGACKHGEHFAKLHRPEGLGRFRWERTEKLVIDICSSLVNSEARFRCDATKGEYHPYKDYRDIFPDWIIQSDVSLEASDYWKYVLAKFNKEFAEAYNAEPADIPEIWKTITHKQAEASLKESFNIK